MWSYAQIRIEINNMTPEINKLLALNYMRGITIDEIVDLAGDALNQGLDTPNLRILAGLKCNKPLFRDEVEEYLYKSIKDLGYSVPGENECLWNYVKFICQQIINNEITPFEGLRIIYSVSLHEGHPKYLRDWLYLSDELSLDDYRTLSEEELMIAINKSAKDFVDGIFLG
jgi:hypothetical protein